ncbi:DUF503 family protein [candidate division KSB1 bacterium]|nr:DUF503 family protein [candidate division KSB1 bacterium]
MLVGLLQLEIFIPDSASLKEKRFVLLSLKQRLRNKFNISIAEIDQNDKWQLATLGVAVVANEKRFVEKTLNKIFSLVEQEHNIQIMNQQFEIL